METNEKKEQIIDFKQYKGIVSSSLQKSLRRGRFDLAQEYVKFLWEHDQNYITYRLSTILSEDVGVANINLVNQYLDTKIAKKAVEEAGGVDFILDIVEQACNSTKDRTSCDLAYLSSYYNFPEDISVDHKTLAKIFHNSQENLITRVQAGWLTLGGKKFNSDHLPFQPYVNENNITIDNVEGFSLLLEEYNNPQLKDMVLNSYLTQRENISLGIPIVYAAFEEEKRVFDYNSSAKIKPGDVVEHNYIKEETFFHEPTGLNIISCGIDGHTKEGKYAYYDYLKTKNKFSQYLNKHNVPYQIHATLLSHCIFRIEGHEVNKRVYFPTAVNVMRQCESAILNFKAGTELNFVELRKIVIEDIPLINSLRNKQLQSMPVPMIDKPEPKKPKKVKKTS